MHLQVDCGIYEFDHTVNEYEFLTQNYKAVSKDQGKFYAVEFNHQLKKNLYCIVSILHNKCNKLWDRVLLILD